MPQQAEILESAAQTLGTPLQCLVCAAWFAGFFAVSRLLRRVIAPRLVRAARRRERPYLSILLESFSRPAAALTAYAGLYIALRLLPFPFFGTAGWLAALSCLTRILCILLTSWGLLGAAPCVALALSGAAGRAEHGPGATAALFLQRVYKAVVVLFAAVLSITELGYNVSSLIAGLGLGGLTFALAAQDTAANFFSGLMILLEKPFSVGDWISTASVEGTVEDITFRSTKIRTLGNALTLVPNSRLSADPITNWSRLQMRLAQFTLGLTYSTPRKTIEAVTERVRAMLISHPDVFPDTVQVRLLDFSGSSMDVFVLFYTKITDIAAYRVVREDVNLRILDIMAQEGASFAFPSRSIYLETPGPVSPAAAKEDPQ